MSLPIAIDAPKSRGALVDAAAAAAAVSRAAEDGVASAEELDEEALLQMALAASLSTQ